MLVRTWRPLAWARLSLRLGACQSLQVPPAELETLLLTHPGVADVCVVGVPDEDAGELPRAYCVKKQGAENTTADDIINFVAG